MAMRKTSLGLAMAMAVAGIAAAGLGSRALAQPGPAASPAPCQDCPTTDPFDPMGGPLTYDVTAHLFPRHADGSELWWYDGAPGAIKYAPVQIDIHYTGACGGLGQPSCVYHFVSDENGNLSTQNPTRPSSFNCVIESYPDDYFVWNWQWLGGACGYGEVPEPCWDPAYQSGVMTSHFTDTDLSLTWLARLGQNCAENGCAYFDKIVLTPLDPYDLGNGLRATDPNITCPVSSGYWFIGGSSVTIPRSQFSGFVATSQDGTPCEGSADACVSYTYIN